MDQTQEFSKKWVFISMAIYITSEILIGYLIGGIMLGKYVSSGLQFMMQGLCMLLAFYIGGFIIGFVSPGLRILEPALGAFLSVATMMTITLFTPSFFFHFNLFKLVVGGTIAFCLALAGAKTAERLTGQLPQKDND